MKRIITLVALIAALAAGVDAFGRGGGFGGGHFGGGFGGGGYGGGARGFSGGGNFGSRQLRRLLLRRRPIHGSPLLEQRC